MGKMRTSEINKSLKRRILVSSGKARQCKAFFGLRPACNWRAWLHPLALEILPLNVLLRKSMTFSKTGLCTIIIAVFFLSPAALLAGTECDAGAGPLNTAQPQGTTPQEIIQKFAAREETFREARNNYTYTQDILVQELDGSTVTGEFRLVQDVTYDDKGGRIENVTFAPQNTLRQLQLSREDFEDFRYKMAFIMTTADIPHYNLLYVGQQH